MTVHVEVEIQSLQSVRDSASPLRFEPLGTVRCAGTPLFRTQLARDLGCLLDVDPDVVSWKCLPVLLRDGAKTHVPDFQVVRGNGTCFLDAVDPATPQCGDWIDEVATRVGNRRETALDAEIRSGARLVNARDLLRYARWRCPLGDRIRLLAALDENSSMTVAECLPAFRETPPIAGLSSLILHRFVEIDLDETRIGPETQVRRSHG
ncbi:hypothetical protein [Mesorhizobium sp. CAU 1732]|uniref:hypothetical protein n=1 Tax=Mesorhizobium sp. CAU 1732 TaxID=3140358 RepID=UPI003260462B